ncbi:MAG: hypothetical protein AAGE03_15055 [Pseudomonadota bacterium]
MMRVLLGRPLRSLLVIATLAGAPGAWAQSWESYETAQGVGASICPVRDDETANYWCFALMCSARGEAARFVVQFAGGELAGGPYGLDVFVDGDPVGRLALAEQPVEGITRLEVPFDPAAHGDVLEGLRRGDAAILKLTHAGQAIFHGVTLRGSSRALGFATEACGAGAPLPASGSGGAGLSAAEVRAELLGRRLYWGDDLNGVGTIYQPGGRFEGIMMNDGRGRANNGNYEVMADGRICWQGHVSGCFRFYRRDGEIWVRRDDDRSQAELGAVQITPL